MTFDGKRKSYMNQSNRLIDRMIDD